MRIAGVGRALPDNHYDQETLLLALERLWGERFYNKDRLAQLHRNVRVGGRHLALPIDEYEKLDGFTAANDAFIRCGTDVGARAIGDALDRARLTPQDIDHLFFVSVTGVATPSIDARLVNRLELRSDVKRTPIFGLGCVAGAAGVARAADYVRAFPDQVAVLLSVELCSLTLQRQDLSIPNLIATGLFGDGAAAVVLAGSSVELSAGSHPNIVATKSVFYPHTEDVMGWNIGTDGFGLILSSDIPKIVERHMRADVESFLSAEGLSLGDIDHWVCHPGGPKILAAFEQSLALDSEALALTHESLASLGNLSSASVLMVLRDTLDTRAPKKGSYGLMLAMGPGFCSELVLLRW